MERMMLKKSALAVLLAAGVFVVGSCANSAETKKTADKAAPAAATTAQKIDKAALTAKVKDAYICPKINMSIADAEAEGALCPEGKKMLDMLDKMVAGGTMAEAEILDLIQNYRIQGRALVETNGQQVCGTDGKLKMDYFIMSYCPYGVRFVDTTLKDMKTTLGTTLDAKPHYIMYPKGDGTFEAMHGQKEADENMRQICIREKWGMEKWNDYFNCFAREIYDKANSGNAKDWKFCAAQVDIKADDLETCFKNEAPKLAQVDVQLSQQYGAQGSPTAVYNCSKNIVGAIPFDQIKKQVCKLIPGTKPATCVN